MQLTLVFPADHMLLLFHDKTITSENGFEFAPWKSHRVTTTCCKAGWEKCERVGAKVRNSAPGVTEIVLIVFMLKTVADTIDCEDNRIYYVPPKSKDLTIDFQSPREFFNFPPSDLLIFFAPDKRQQQECRNKGLNLHTTPQYPLPLIKTF